MYEAEIVKKVEKLKIPSFLGTFPIDRLPIPMKIPVCFILNHDKFNGEGTHWVAVSILENNVVEYFDSFARKPPEELFNWRKNIIYNRKPIQNILAETCGYHALYYLYLRHVLKWNRNETLDYLYKLKNADFYVKRFIQLY